MPPRPNTPALDQRPVRVHQDRRVEHQPRLLLERHLREQVRRRAPRPAARDPRTGRLPFPFRSRARRPSISKDAGSAMPRGIIRSARRRVGDNRRERPLGGEVHRAAWKVFTGERPDQADALPPAIDGRRPGSVEPERDHRPATKPPFASSLTRRSALSARTPLVRQRVVAGEVAEAVGDQRAGTTPSRAACGPDAKTRSAPASTIACANATGFPRSSPRIRLLAIRDVQRVRSFRAGVHVDDHHSAHVAPPCGRAPGSPAMSRQALRPAVRRAADHGDADRAARGDT